MQNSIVFAFAIVVGSTGVVPPKAFFRCGSTLEEAKYNLRQLKFEYPLQLDDYFHTAPREVTHIPWYGKLIAKGIDAGIHAALDAAFKTKSERPKRSYKYWTTFHVQESSGGVLWWYGVQNTNHPVQAVTRQNYYKTNTDRARKTKILNWFRWSVCRGEPYFDDGTVFPKLGGTLEKTTVCLGTKRACFGRCIPLRAKCVKPKPKPKPKLESKAKPSARPKPARKKKMRKVFKAGS